MLEQFEQNSVHLRTVYWKLEVFVCAINNTWAFEKSIDILMLNSCY